MNDAERIAKYFAEKYNLNYRSQVNLEGCINNMFFYDLSEDEIVNLLDDLYENCTDQVSSCITQPTPFEPPPPISPQPGFFTFNRIYY